MRAKDRSYVFCRFRNKVRMIPPGLRRWKGGRMAKVIKCVRAIAAQLRQGHKRLQRVNSQHDWLIDVGVRGAHCASCMLEAEIHQSIILIVDNWQTEQGAVACADGTIDGAVYVKPLWAWRRRLGHGAHLPIACCKPRAGGRTTRSHFFPTDRHFFVQDGTSLTQQTVSGF